jgi:hypothetical protein
MEKSFKTYEDPFTTPFSKNKSSSIFGILLHPFSFGESVANSEIIPIGNFDVIKNDTDLLSKDDILVNKKRLYDEIDNITTDYISQLESFNKKKKLLDKLGDKLLQDNLLYIIKKELKHN